MAYFFVLVEIFPYVKLELAFLEFLSQYIGVAYSNYCSVRFVYFDVHYKEERTGDFAPHASQCLNFMPFSVIILVSGFPHSPQITNSFVYASTFSLTFEEFSLALRMRRSFSSLPDVASSLCRNLERCSTGLRI